MSIIYSEYCGDCALDKTRTLLETTMCWLEGHHSRPESAAIRVIRRANLCLIALRSALYRSRFPWTGGEASRLPSYVSCYKTMPF
jgi:hypothetical protein